MNRGDGRFVEALGGHGNREPSRRTAGPNAVAVSPVAARVLNAVKQKDNVSLPDRGEVATPWKVVALRYENGGQVFFPPSWIASREQASAILRLADVTCVGCRFREESS